MNLALDRRSLVVSLLALAVIAASATWTWKTQLAPKPFNAYLQTGIGEALAQRTISLLNGNGKVLVVTLEPGDSPTVRCQFDAFQAALRLSPGITLVKIETLDADKKSKYGPGAGLSASRLLRLIGKNPDIDALISFVGLPDLDENELQQLGRHGPRLIGFSRHRKKLGSLLASRRLEAAAVPRFQFPSPIQGTPSSPSEWFDLQCQWVTPADVNPD